MRPTIAILLFLWIPVISHAQQSAPTDTTCFTQEEITSLYEGLRELEVSDSLKTEKIALQEDQITNLRAKIEQFASLDSLKEEKINTLNDRLNLQEEKISLLEKKIRRNRYKHILMGAAGGVLLGVLIK
ncbi:MAG: hypothetical protein R3281_07505 [Balneolaceae bacterium]|nr:hypothetical protein [Balneolaceae bacterium]